MLDSARAGGHRRFRSTDIEGQRLGTRRLLKAGFTMFGVAATFWLIIIGATAISSNSKPDPIAQVLILTFTILLWPVATLGLLALLCWLVIRVVEAARSLGR